MSVFKRFATAGVFLLMAMLGLGQAVVEAKIVCKNGAQRVGGSWISTPYCEDALLGQVAREHGFRVSDRELRQNPNKKRNICRFVGKDIRVQETCIQSDGGSRRGGF